MGSPRVSKIKSVQRVCDRVLHPCLVVGVALRTLHLAKCDRMRSTGYESRHGVLFLDVRLVRRVLTLVVCSPVDHHRSEVSLVGHVLLVGLRSQACVGVSTIPPPAASSRAFLSVGGNCLPRRDARRRIPEHALAESEYLLGASLCSTCHKKATLPSLGHSEVAAVKNSPRDLLTIPAFAHFTDNGGKVESVIACEHSRDIFEYEQPWMD